MPLPFRDARLIFNPNAGTIIRRKPLFDRAVESLRRQGMGLTLVPTERAGHATSLARDAAARGADLIIAAGGDGTVNEVCNGMVGSRTPLAVLPCGTANVLACETGIGLDPAAAADRFDSLVPRRIAIGLLRPTGAPERHFLLMAGVGLDAEVLQHVDLGIKRWGGKLAYWLAGFSMLGRALPRLRATVDSRGYEASFLLAARVRNYGGDLALAAGADLLSDEFDVIAFRNRWATSYLPYVVAAVFGKAGSLPGADTFRARAIRCEPVSPQVHLQIDGEQAGTLPAEIRIVPDALTLLLPERFVRRR